MNILVLEKMGIVTEVWFRGRRENFFEFVQKKIRDGYLVNIPSSSWPKDKNLLFNKNEKES
ncbi:MAG: hypothetical protein AAB396_00280 [Patescibacteria group bacterium]